MIFFNIQNSIKATKQTSKKMSEIKVEYEYDDNGVKVVWNKETEGWDCLEPYCRECGKPESDVEVDRFTIENEVFICKDCIKKVKQTSKKISRKKYNLIIESDESDYDYREYCEDRLRYNNEAKYLDEEKKKMTKQMIDAIERDGISMDYIVPMMPKSKKIHILKNYYNEILNSSKEWRNGVSINFKLKSLKGIENVEVWGQDNEKLNQWIRGRTFIHKLFEV